MTKQMTNQENDFAVGFFNSRVYVQYAFIRMNTIPEENICVGMIYAGTFKQEDSPKLNFFHSDVLISEEKLKLAQKILKPKAMTSYFKKTLLNIKKQNLLKLNYLGMEYLFHNHHNTLHFSRPSVYSLNYVSEAETLFQKRVNTINP